MYLFNNRAAIADAAQVFTTPEIIASVQDANNHVALAEPLLRYGVELDKILAERIGEVVAYFDRVRMRMLICVLIALAVKIWWNLHDVVYVSSWTKAIWDEGKWTALFLGLFWWVWIVFKYFTMTFQITVMTREAMLGLSMAYDAMFAKNQSLREKLWLCTLEANREQMIHNKGYLLAHLEDLVEKAYKAIPLISASKETILNDLKGYASLMVTQYNTWDHFADNYRKTTSANLKA